MGYPEYSLSSRSERASKLNYFKAFVNTDSVFTQNVEQRMHDEMNPKKVTFRECRDSANHPNATPIQFYLDVTGSMHDIPKQMIIDGLPTLMSSLIQNGVPDAALMFGAIGDHECDRAPLQVGQFESGDAELDMWLTRTWLEGKGGGNAGESYLLAWYFAANHVKTDSFEKRHRKGFVFTVGDEPYLRKLPISALKSLMENAVTGQVDSYSAEELLTAAQATNHVYHIHINHGRECAPTWKQLLGDNLIEISDHKMVTKVISDIILKVLKDENIETAPLFKPSVEVKIEEENML